MANSEREKADCISRNPVRAGLVERWEDGPWVWVAEKRSTAVSSLLRSVDYGGQAKPPPKTGRDGSPARRSLGVGGMSRPWISLRDLRASARISYIPRCTRRAPEQAQTEGQALPIGMGSFPACAPFFLECARLAAALPLVQRRLPYAAREGVGTST